MKHYIGKFPALITIFICFVIIPNGVWAQIFSNDIAFLRDGVLQEAEKKEHTSLTDFITVVLPELDDMIKEDSYNLKNGLNNISKEQIIQKDIMIFAYNKAIIKLNKPYGSWDEEIKNNTFFLLELICSIKEMLNLKPPEYESQMLEINQKFLKGSYANTLKWLSLSPYFYEVTYETVQKTGKFPKVEDLLIMSLLEFANSQ